MAPVFLLLFAAEIAGLHVLFVWLDRRWPPRPAVDLSHLDDDVRRRMARRANRLGTFASLLAWPLATAAWGLGFYALQQAMIPMIPGAIYVRTPSGALHLTSGIFA